MHLKKFLIYVNLSSSQEPLHCLLGGLIPYKWIVQEICQQIAYKQSLDWPLPLA